MANRDYSDEVRAAVMASLLAGQSVSAVAREYKLPKGTVSDWKRKAAEGVGPTPTQKRNEIGAMLLELVEANIAALVAVSHTMADPEWSRKQSASELGTIFGITYDKVIRMLEAMGGDDGGAA